MRGQRYRAAIAVTFTGCALAFFVADHALNVQNVVMSIAALISIAALLPLHRQHEPKSSEVGPAKQA
jgi:hypothetical protein